MPKISTSWNFKLFYKSEKDPQIEKDIELIEQVCDGFASKYIVNHFLRNYI
jgi:hypothetical protein